MSTEDLDYRAFANFLEESSGIVLGPSKAYLVSSRLSDIMKEEKVSTLTELVNHMKEPSKAKLKERVVDAMTTNETNWFRDNHPFDVLRTKILPELRDVAKTRPIKIWSSACSSGQEPLTISMTVSEYMAANPGTYPHNVQILATDISPSMLEQAKEATYDSIAMSRGLSAERKKKFFDTLDDGRMQAKQRERARINYRSLNLLTSFVLIGKFDVIFCRNVLIYFSDDVKSDILTRMSQNLNPNGYLFIGASESMSSTCESYNMIKCNPGLVYQKK